MVDANTYSCGDLFTAGFVDNRLGPVISIGTASGAGGANVWSDFEIPSAFRNAGRRLPVLPDGVGYTLAIRRMVRTGDAEGSVIEDVGVTGRPYQMTSDDVLLSNRDLLQFCVGLLADTPITAMNCVRKPRRGHDSLTITTTGIDRVDIELDGRPDSSHETDDHTALDVVLAVGSTAVTRGYTEGVLRQLRRQPHRAQQDSAPSRRSRP